MALSRSACDAVLILIFAFGALLFAVAVFAGLAAELAFVFVAFVWRSLPELQAVVRNKITAKDKSAEAEIIFRVNIDSPFAGIVCGGGVTKV